MLTSSQIISTGKRFTKYYKIGLLIGVIALLQLWFISTQQLFGDEAFYWLEGQFLNISYSELPGWTAWMIRLGTEVFGNNYFAVRIFSYLGFLSVFRAIWLLNKSVETEGSINFILIMAIPLLMLIAVMALPDVWLLVFVMWISVWVVKSVQSNNYKDWFILGLLIACSINVHVRMWIWLAIAGMVFLLYYRTNKTLLKRAILVCFPIALMGLLPVLIFNYHHDFALFTFQFGRRHPWEFQVENLSFVLSQILVITPLVLFLWFKNISQINMTKPNIAWILLTAFLHWLLYVMLSLFADGLRTTVHWVLISYLPVLAISSLWQTNYPRLMWWSAVTGIIVSLFLLIVVNNNQRNNSYLEARIFDNSRGWKELSVNVNRVKKEQGIDRVVTDYFMTAAELAFETNNTQSIYVLPHFKNVKHGREKQLDIMGLLINEPEKYNKEALLVVEDSTLKLQQKGRYYFGLCQYFKQLEFIETIYTKDSHKQFHLFKINNSNENKQCQIPPIFYIEHQLADNVIHLSGWAIFHQVGIKSLSVVSGEYVLPVTTIRIENTGISAVFPDISDPNNPYNGFQLTMDRSNIQDNQLKILATGNDEKQYFSHLIFVE